MELAKQFLEAWRKSYGMDAAVLAGIILNYCDRHELVLDPGLRVLLEFDCAFN